MDVINSNHLSQVLESLKLQVHCLNYLRGVSNDSALYAYLVIAERSLESAIFHVDEYCDHLGSDND